MSEWRIGTLNICWLYDRTTRERKIVNVNSVISAAAPTSQEITASLDSALPSAGATSAPPDTDLSSGTNTAGIDSAIDDTTELDSG